MARPLRIEFSGALYHVTAHGNAGFEIVLDDEDRAALLRQLGAVCERFAWRVHAYCLLDNRYDLVVETMAPTLARGMRQLGGVYTQTFNRRHRRGGHVFQGRYKAVLVERETFLLAVCRHVVLEPVHEGKVRAAGDWPWSSYHATAAEGHAPGWLATDWLLAQFGRRPAVTRRAYAAFVAEGVASPPLRDSLHRQVFLGSPEFVEAMLARVGDDRDLSEVPATQRRPPPLPLARYAEDYPDRGEAMARAYLSGSYSQAAIARHFGVHYSTVSRAVRLFEGR